MTDKSSLLDEITTPHIKKWYETHTEPRFLDKLLAKFELEGFTFVPESGIFIRKVLPEFNLDRTMLLGIFPRPVDVHKHENMTEYIEIAGGFGLVKIDVNIDSLLGEKTTHVKPGDALELPRGVTHTFSPMKGADYLKIFLYCDTIYNSKKEICVRRFDEYWNDYPTPVPEHKE